LGNPKDPPFIPFHHPLFLKKKKLTLDFNPGGGSHPPYIFISFEQEKKRERKRKKKRRQTQTQTLTIVLFQMMD
jgi:hypothetical protein